jgi:hypothetical protein
MQFPSTVVRISRWPCLMLDEEGPLLTLADGGRGLVEAAINESARLIAVPAARLEPSFFQLRSGIAGGAAEVRELPPDVRHRGRCVYLCRGE